MKLLVSDPDEVRRLIRQRRRIGADRYDEVWDGVYVMSPSPNPEHCIIAGALCIALGSALDPSLVEAITVGGNVSDRREGWTKNYRVPDLLVFLKGNTAEQCESHWFGGPDFAVEIVSRGDRSRKKFGFYAKVGVRELLLIERKPWRLELYRLQDGAFQPAGTSSLAQPDALDSRVLDLTWTIVPGTPRPRIEVARPLDGRSRLA